MTKIKICGLKRVEDVAYVNESLPEYAGFVFAGSKRNVTDEQAESLSRMLDERIIPVGVFVNEPVEHILDLVEKEVIRVVQLHGDEDEAYIQRLRAGLESNQGASVHRENKKESVKIIKAVRVQRQEQILEAKKLSCDYLLLDTWQKDAYGGCGKQFDKSLIPEDMSKPYFLAGGLAVDNIRENIQICHPYAVDVSSAVETDGKKYEKKIQKFIERVREYE